MKVLVVDNSFYFEFALTLAKSGLFDEVGYFAPWGSDNPTVKEASVGAGFDEVRREYQLWDCLDEYDGFCFPAPHWADMQEWLRMQDRPVWGCGANEALEMDRWLLIQTMQRLGMRVSPSKYVTLAEAKNILEKGDIVKFSTFRGDSETIKFDGDWAWWYQLNVVWGPMRDYMRVVVQKPIPGDHSEPGFDLLLVKGQPIQPFSVGFEVKDGGYIEKNINLQDMPKPLVGIYDNILRMVDADYTNFCSTEVLNEHLLDITCRIPQPPGDLKLYIWQGLASIVYNHLMDNGMGKRDTTNPRHEWGVQLICHNNNPRSYCNYGKIDASIADHVFFERAIKINGEIWTLPEQDMSGQDWTGSLSVVGSGKTPEQAIDDAQRVVDELHLPAHCLIDPSTKDHLMEALEQGEDDGIYLGL